MTNIYTGYGNSPAIYSMVDSKKGTLGNRIDCTIHRAANNVRAAAETTGLGVATYLGYKAITGVTKGKSFIFNTKLNAGLKNTAKEIGSVISNITKGTTNYKGVKKVLSKAAEYGLKGVKKACEALSKTSGRQKLLGALGVAAIGTLIAIGRKHAYKEGEYEERYNTRAKSIKS